MNSITGPFTFGERDRTIQSREQIQRLISLVGGGVEVGQQLYALITMSSQ